MDPGYFRAGEASLHSSDFPDVEAWARHYVCSFELSVKLSPPPVPSAFAASADPVRIERPGRPAELVPARRPERTAQRESLETPRGRARALHTFLHHELQAAELMCWALLAFSDAEPDFRKGLLGICQDEIRHMNLYREHIERLGFRVGSFAVRDWFWKRVPPCPSKVAFVAVMGMGFEGANLEHARTFAERFRAAGDEEGARIQERIALEEIGHVGFATRWFTRWTGGCSFDEWVSNLPPPISPWVLRGLPVDRAARRRAGMSDDFITALTDYVPEPKGRKPE